MAGFPLESLPDDSPLKRQRSVKVLPSGSPSAARSSGTPTARSQKYLLDRGGSGTILDHTISTKMTFTPEAPASAETEEVKVETDMEADVVESEKTRLVDEEEKKAAAIVAARRLEALKQLKDAEQHCGLLRASGYTIDELKSVGFDVEELIGDADFSLAEIKEAGFTAMDCKAAGFALKEIRKIGYSIHEISQCGYSQREVEYAASVTPMKRQTTLRTNALVKLRRAGQNAGMSRLAGYSLEELKSAGYTVSELVTDGGYNISELKSVKFTAAECKASGLYSWMDLKKLGYTLDEMKAGGGNVRDMTEIGFTASRLYNVLY